MSGAKPDSGPKIIVLGAGISGLSAAFYSGRTMPGATVRLWEKSGRVGGVLHTVERDGFQIEQSADNFITTEPYALDLCKAVGLESDVVRTSNEYRRTFVVRDNRLYPLPDGFLMMAPTKFMPLVLTPLLSPLGKLRAGLELMLPRGKKRDESLEQFVVRRLGREVFNRIVEPLVSGIYAGDASRLAVWATLPRFPELELKYRSLVLAMKMQQKRARQIKRDEESGARYSFFVAMKHGLSSLVSAVAESLPPGTIETNRRAERIERLDPVHGRPRWAVTDQNGVRDECDAVICAIPSHAYSSVFTGKLAELGAIGAQIEHSGAAVMTVAYRAGQIKKPMLGMGFVVPKTEKGVLIAGSFSSHKYPHRAPEGMTLVRLFAGGTRHPEVVQMPEEELKRLVLDQLGGLLAIEGGPVMVDVARWPATMPQYNLGHLTLLERFDAELTRLPGLALAGNSFRGVGIPVCIKSGKDAAEKIKRTWETQDKT